MNIVFKPSDSTKDKVGSNFVGTSLKTVFLFLIFPLALSIGVTLFLYHVNARSSSIEVANDEELLIEFISSRSVIEMVSESYGVPSEYMERLADYLSANKSRFGGVGLFSVRQEDLGWIQDKVLLETRLDLNDDMQNAQVAAYLLKRFYDSGYSWKESFLIYTFGFSAVHDSSYQDFVNFVFPK